MTIPPEAAVLARAIAELRAAYPRQDFPDASVAYYTRMLVDLPADEVAEAVDRIVRRSPFLPSIAEIRIDVGEASLQLPTAAEAWSMVSDREFYPYEGRLPEVVRESLRAVGGLWTVKHDDNPAVIRAQFVKDYESRRAVAIAMAVGSHPRTELERPAAVHPELAETTQVNPRPVWARRLARVSLYPGDTLPPPTEAERHDAIAVLEAEGWGLRPLLGEAQMIMDEATAHDEAAV